MAVHIKKSQPCTVSKSLSRSKCDEYVDSMCLIKCFVNDCMGKVQCMQQVVIFGCGPSLPFIHR